MNIVVYLTKDDGKIETRTYRCDNPNHHKEYIYLLHEIAVGNKYRQVTIQKVD